MRHIKHLRVPLAALAAAVIATFAPGVALAAPAGDDFDSATEITALPFTGALDTTGATRSSDDPYACDGFGDSTLWLRYTAPADGIVRLRLQSDRRYTSFGVFTGQRGALTTVPGTCTYTPESTFQVTAGTVYHVMVREGSAWESGPLGLSLRTVSPEPNDNRSAARVTTLPATHTGDLRLAGSEPGETPPSCNPQATQSVWYRYTATRTRYVSVGIDRGSISVHRAGDLSEVDCVTGYEDAVFAATEGESYLIRVTESAQNATAFRLEIGTARALSPQINPYYGSDGRAAGAQIGFSVYSGDTHNRNLVSGTISFGDGTSSPIEGDYYTHRYQRDGEYQVTMTGSTRDGRTGTASVTVRIETHDVAITGFVVPAGITPGETKQVRVTVASPLRAEEVKVWFFRAGPFSGQDQLMGHLTQQVSPGGTTEFPFVYTFTAQDVAEGQVTFRAVATFTNEQIKDAKPADNEARATSALHPQ
ncbi:PKD domain-containing protein [Lentzea sp. NPDC102401]|uniref:PKD domain-containing protein n=1 Tax=Lentzea sp. NPDC102401 TaxID=3364128 RepID=UPI00380F44CB